MTFNSWEFLIFYPIVALLYFILPKKLRIPMMLIASYYFYAYYQPDLLFLIIATTAVSYFASRLIAKSDNKTLRRVMLAVTLVVCLGVLFFYKYFNFLSDSVYEAVRFLGGTPTRVELELILPVGISFYTFQTLSYVIDVYRGDVEAERDFIFYALFVSFFPQLVAGPIERPTNLMPELRREPKFNRDDFEKGAKHMLVGFFKKIAVADVVAPYVNAVYNNADEATAPALIIATLLFSVQIYCDFSGYTDIAIGASRIMGIRLMKNFDHPYIAKTIKEFWARWHISLSGWFKDYLYIPLGGNRVSRPRYLFNVFVVFLVSGLWHGASWTFVIWGVLHGIYRTIGEITYKSRNRLIERLGHTPNDAPVVWIRRVITFTLVAFAWIFFRANSMSDAVTLVSRLVTGWRFDNLLTSLGITPVGIVTVVSVIFILLVIDRVLTYEDGDKASPWLIKNYNFVYYIWAAVFGYALLLANDTVSSFIYFQF